MHSHCQVPAAGNHDFELESQTQILRQVKPHEANSSQFLKDIYKYPLFYRFLFNWDICILFWAYLPQNKRHKRLQLHRGRSELSIYHLEKNTFFYQGKQKIDLNTILISSVIPLVK